MQKEVKTLCYKTASLRQFFSVQSFMNQILVSWGQLSPSGESKGGRCGLVFSPQYAKYLQSY